MQLADAQARVRALALDNDSVVAAAQVTDLLTDAYYWLTGHRTLRTRVITTTNLISLSSGGFAIRLTDSNSRGILRVLEITSGATQHGKPMWYLPYQDLLALRRRSATSGTPKYWTWMRHAGDSQAVRLMFYPTASASFDGIAVTLSIPSIPSNASDAFDVNQHDAYAMTRIAGLDLAHVLNRGSQLRESIGHMLPMALQLQLGMLDEALGPRPPLDSPV